MSAKAAAPVKGGKVAPKADKNKKPDPKKTTKPVKKAFFDINGGAKAAAPVKGGKVAPKADKNKKPDPKKITKPVKKAFFEEEL